jgi:hypothetical protein
MSIDMKLQIDIGGGHIDVESFYLFQHLIQFNLKHCILQYFELQIVVNKLTL